MSKTVSAYVDIDVDDILHQISNEVLAKELEDRNIAAIQAKQEEIDLSFVPLVEEALTYLRIGRADDAALTLERALYPKWEKPEQVLQLMTKMRQAS